MQNNRFGEKRKVGFVETEKVAMPPEHLRKVWDNKYSTLGLLTVYFRLSRIMVICRPKSIGMINERILVR